MERAHLSKIRETPACRRESLSDDRDLPVVISTGSCQEPSIALHALHPSHARRCQSSRFEAESQHHPSSTRIVFGERVSTVVMRSTRTRSCAAASAYASCERHDAVRGAKGARMSEVSADAMSALTSCPASRYTPCEIRSCTIMFEASASRDDRFRTTYKVRLLVRVEPTFLSAPPSRSSFMNAH